MKKSLAVLLAAYWIGTPAVSSAAICTEVWIPVCGNNGFPVYSNECYAGNAGVAVRSDGQCFWADDSDYDWVRGTQDNCPTVANASQADLDGDSLGDACDSQTCGNGVAEGTEPCDDGNSDNWDSCTSTCTANQTYQITIDPATSIIHTSGGITGGGIGDVQVQGTFQAVISGNQIKFTNTSVTTIPADSGFVFPSYIGSYTAATAAFSGSQATYPAGRYDNYSGTLAGGQLTMQGKYNFPAYDGYVYDFTINASSPPPVTPPVTPAAPPTVNGDVIDAPHNSSFGISCRDCHSYTLWWQYAPMSAADAGYAAKVRAICLTCHGPGGGSLPAQLHGSAVLGSQYGSWEADCRDCHDSHFQAQLDWKGTVPASDLYLVTGTVSSIQTDTVNGTSTLAYSLTSTAASWTDPATWSNKNGPGRGLILVLDATLAQQTFQLTAADSTTITVKGTVDPSYGGKSFGLLYGQQINSTIATPAGSKEVKFFDPKGSLGFTNAETPATGICQVCHTQTNGSDTNHWGTAVCSSCHSMAGGFGTPAP